MGHRSFGGQFDDTEGYVASRYMEVRRRQGSGSSTRTELEARLAVGEELNIYFYFLIYST